MNLKINVQYDDVKENWHVKLTGDLDINSSINLKDELSVILDKHESNIIIEAEELNYIDSTGLGVLISLLKRMNSFEKNMMIRNPQDNILKIFKITGLFKVIRIEKDGEIVEG